MPMNAAMIVAEFEFRPPAHTIHRADARLCAAPAARTVVGNRSGLDSLGRKLARVALAA
jgi:hypothetical protein